MVDRIESVAPAEAGKAAELNARHDRYLWDAVIRYYETPLPLARGRGQYLYDYDGREYLDFFGGILTVSVGHCHPTRDAGDPGAGGDARPRRRRCIRPRRSWSWPRSSPRSLPGARRRGSSPTAAPRPTRPPSCIARVATGSQEVIALRHGYSGRSMLAQSLTAHAPVAAPAMRSRGSSTRRALLLSLPAEPRSPRAAAPPARRTSRS